jgi:hypothetical protein
VRTILIEGHAWSRVAHRSEARAVLLQAIAEEGPLRENGIVVPGLTTEAVLDRDRACEALKPSLQGLTLSPHNTRLCELLSEALLQGDDTWPGWLLGQGESRLQAYAAIPQALRTTSRALLHHHANVLRRTTHWSMLGSEKCHSRLIEARSMLRRALELPWQTGVRDEHPGHLMTTLGLVEKGICKYVQGAERSRHHLEAIRLMDEALCLIPESQPTRQGLAGLVLEDAQQLLAAGRRQEAADQAARVLGLLSTDPPTAERHERKWHETKRQAHNLFGDKKGQEYLRELQARGIEQGFLLDAELCLVDGRGTDAAIRLLEPLTSGEQAARHLKSARRLASLFRDHPIHRVRFAERRRLLAVVEAAQSPGVRLSTMDEFELAVLEYHVGRYAEGGQRFATLRNTGRSLHAELAGQSFLNNAEGKPERFQGKVTSNEGFRGWMSIHRLGSPARLFSVPFVARLFSDTPVGRSNTVVIRFTPVGPQAVPARFAEGWR